MEKITPKGPKPSKEEQEILEKVEEEILALPFSDEAKTAARTMLANGEKQKLEDALSIWEIALDRQQEIPALKYSMHWIDDGRSGNAAHQHMLKHVEAFRELWRNEEILKEVFQGVTTFGTLAIIQEVAMAKRARPAFMLMYEGMPIALAVSMGSNGLIVGTTFASFMDCLDRGPHKDKQGHYNQDKPIDSIGQYKTATDLDESEIKCEIV